MPRTYKAFMNCSTIGERWDGLKQVYTIVEKKFEVPKKKKIEANK